MYNADLQEKTIPLDSLYLDPNNPRFPDKRGTIKSARIVDREVQAKAFERISSYGVRELANSILRNGFLPLDRIVVSEIPEHSDCYVVVEGNRRLAALRTVYREIDEDEVDADDLSTEYLSDLRDSISEIPCLVYTGSDKDIAWILQGVRHLSGIRDWSPAQKAELVVREIDQNGLKFRAVGEMLGMTANQVGKYYRAFKALEQMKNDPDYGDRYDKTLFTLFDEAYSKTGIRKWLGWSDSAHRFENEDQLKLFYSWITPDPDNDNVRRIHDPRQMKIVNKMVDPDHTSVLQDFADGTLISIEQAESQLTGDVPTVDWRGKIAQAEDALRHVPLVALTDPDELAQKLEILKQSVERLISAVAAAAAKGDSRD